MKIFKKYLSICLILLPVTATQALFKKKTISTQGSVQVPQDFWEKFPNLYVAVSKDNFLIQKIEPAIQKQWQDLIGRLGNYVDKNNQPLVDAYKKLSAANKEIFSVLNIAYNQAAEAFTSKASGNGVKISGDLTAQNLRKHPAIVRLIKEQLNFNKINLDEIYSTISFLKLLHDPERPRLDKLISMVGTKTSIPLLDEVAQNLKKYTKFNLNKGSFIPETAPDILMFLDQSLQGIIAGIFKHFNILKGLKEGKFKEN